ncbi:MAG TPA: hypothetical protein VLB29_11970 [Nocardioidaceae bacterium]|nr:hypothetical protein [Nocardioidaceae bacterium]
MYARTSTLMCDPSAIDNGIAYVRDEVWPAVREMNGCLGMSLIVDRQSGKAIATTSWETEGAISASRNAVIPLRERAAEIMGATSSVVEEWELGSMHRAHNSNPDACVRTTWIEVDPDKVDDVIDFYKTQLLPPIEQYDGFASASLLVNRSKGRAVVSVAFDSREAMERTRPKAAELRDKAQEAGMRIAEVAECELALAHLHAPELV